MDGQAIPSCECNGLDGGTCFDDNNWIAMVGPVLASGIATLRGYEGRLFRNSYSDIVVSHLIFNDDSGNSRIP